MNNLLKMLKGHQDYQQLITRNEFLMVDPSKVRKFTYRLFFARNDDKF